MNDWLRWIFWMLRGSIVIILFHYPVVLFGLLRPRTYVRDLRIKRTLDGRPLIPNGLFAVYAIRLEGKDCPFWVLDMLDGLRSARINVYLVSNSNLNEQQIALLRTYAYRLIVRDGSGRDFGSYKDAIIELFERSDIKRLLLLNDSLYVFRSRLDKMLSELTADSDAVIATNENIEVHYHLQSFAISIPKMVFDDIRFRAFWKRFLPLTEVAPFSGTAWRLS